MLVRISTRIAVVALLMVGLWHFSGLILSSDKGFELTDEALYLLVSREVGSQSQWGFPAGWNTAPLFWFAGYDVAVFRTLGACILALASVLLALDCHTLLTRGTNFKLPGRFGKSLSSRALLFALSGYLGSLLYYVSLLRVPSYNWLNLVGLLIATSGFVKELGMGDRTLSGVVAITRFLPGALSGLGLFIAFPGKPSTPVLFMALATILLIPTRGTAGAIMFSTVSSACLLLCIVIAVSLKLWPYNFLDYFFEAAMEPSLSDENAVLNAVYDLIVLPISLVETITGDSIGTALLAGSIVIAMISAVAVSARRELSLAGLFVGWALVVWVAGVGPFVLKGSLSLGQWGTESTGTSFLLLFAIYFTSWLSRNKNKLRRRGVETNAGNVLAASVMLCGVPLMFSFGTSNSLIGQLSHSGITLILASLILAASTHRQNLSLWRLIPILIFTLFTVFVAIFQSHENPYRLEPIMVQTVEVSIPMNSNTSLLLDQVTAKKLLEVREALSEAGFTSGTPVISLQWRWNSALPFFIEASVPDSAMPTLFGYSGSLVRLEQNLSADCVTFDCANSWLIVSNLNFLEDAEANEVAKATSIFATISKRNFPDGYRLVLETEELLIYRPRQ